MYTFESTTVGCFFSFHDLGSLYSEFARNERNHSRRALACATLPRCGPVRWNSLGETNSLDVFGEGESSRLLFPLDKDGMRRNFCAPIEKEGFFFLRKKDR